MPLQSKIFDLDSSAEGSKTSQSPNTPKDSSATEVETTKRKRKAKKKKQKKQRQQMKHELERQQELVQETIAVSEDTSHPLLNLPRAQEASQVDHESNTVSTQKETTAIILQSSDNDYAEEAHKDLDCAPQAQPFSLGSYELTAGINNLIAPSLPDPSSTLNQSTLTASSSIMFTPAPQYFKKPLPSESSASQSTKTIRSQHEAEMVCAAEEGSVTDTRLETTDSAEGQTMFSLMDSDSDSVSKDLQQRGNTDCDYEHEFKQDVVKLTEEKTEYEDTGIDPTKEPMAATSRQQEDLSEQNDVLFMRYQRAIMKLNNMQTELAAQEKSRQNAEEAFQQQIDDLKKQRRDLKALMETLKRKEQEQKELCEEASKKMTKYIELATTQKKRADHCTAEVLRLQADLEDVNNMLTETREEYDTLEYQYTILENRYKRLIEEQRPYGNQQDTTDRIHELTREVMQLTVENHTLKVFLESHYPTSTQVSPEQTPSPPQRERRLSVQSLMEELRGAGIVLDSEPGGQSSNTISPSVSPSEHHQNDKHLSQDNEATNEFNSQLTSLRSEPAVEQLVFDTPPSTQGPLPPNVVPSEHTLAIINELGIIRGHIFDLDSRFQGSASQLQRVLGFHHNQQLFIQQLYFQELAHEIRSDRQRQRVGEAQRPEVLSYIGWKLPLCALGAIALFAVVDGPKFATAVQKLPSLMLKLALNTAGLELTPT